MLPVLEAFHCSLLLLNCSVSVFCLSKFGSLALQVLIFVCLPQEQLFKSMDTARPPRRLILTISVSTLIYSSLHSSVQDILLYIITLTIIDNNLFDYCLRWILWKASLDLFENEFKTKYTTHLEISQTFWGIHDSAVNASFDC